MYFKMMRSDEPFQLYITKCKEFKLYHAEQRTRAATYDFILYTNSALIISCQGVISGITAGGYEGIDLQTTGIVGLVLSASLLVLGKCVIIFHLTFSKSNIVILQTNSTT